MPHRLPLVLLSLRFSIFVVMLAWTIDKFARPAHAIGVYEKFYGIDSVNRLGMYSLAVAELLLLFAFVLGIKRHLCYGLVLALHAVSTFSSWRQYLDPFTGNNLLFFAAWPMLAACLTLYLMRDQDTLLTLRRWR